MSETPTESTGIATTGVDSVDAVVATLPSLDALPVAEHVAVFESAHESLRRALSDASRD